ncbi:MAG TPA: GtrA family protein [Streptosporangiaceae bacterium]|nr:GtrA family protein [Streptosporangiaceae bacterium]
MAEPGGRTASTRGISLLDNSFMMVTDRAKLGRPVRFCLVGGTGIAVNTAVLYVLSRGLGWPLAVSSAMAVEFAVLNNYLLNDRFTFAARRPSLRRLAKFNITSLAGLSVNVMLVWFLARRGLYFLSANFVGIAAAAAVNYTFSVAWVWRREK